MILYILSNATCYCWRSVPVRTLFDVLATLEEYGLVLFTDAKKELGQVKLLTNRIAYPRQSHYGCVPIIILHT